MSPDSMAAKKRLALTLLFVAISLKRPSFGRDVADVEFWWIRANVLPAGHGRVEQLNTGKTRCLLFCLREISIDSILNFGVKEIGFFLDVLKAPPSPKIGGKYCSREELHDSRSTPVDGIPKQDVVRMAWIDSMADEERKDLYLISTNSVCCRGFIPTVVAQVSPFYEEAFDERNVAGFNGVEKVGF
jgi:hypothetical protein